MPRAKPIHPPLTSPRYSLGGHRNILDLIASYVADDATLSGYMRVSWGCYDVAGPKLYHHVVCSDHRALKAIVRGAEVGAPMATRGTPYPINRKRQLLQHTRILSVSVDQCCNDPDSIRLFIQACNAAKLTVWAKLREESCWISGEIFEESRRRGKYSRAWGSTVGKVVLKNLSSSRSFTTDFTTVYIISWMGILPPADSISLVLPTRIIYVDWNITSKLPIWSHAYTELSIILDSENTAPPDCQVLDDGIGFIAQTSNFLMFFTTSLCPGTINVCFMDDFTPPDGDGISWSPFLCRSIVEVEYGRMASWLLGDGERPTFNFRTRKDYLDGGVTDEYTAEEVANLKRAEARSLARAETSDTVL